MITSRQLAAAFALYGMLATAFLAINVPPYQNVDEQAHFWRAAQIADGHLLATRFTATDPDGAQHLRAGGPLDPALRQIFLNFNGLVAHPETRATPAMWLPNLHWSHQRTLLRFPNSAVNPPFFYLPAAIGVLAGRVTRMTITQTLVLCRLLTALAAIAIAAAAIATAGGAAIWLFALLTLPRSLSLIASPSQEALMLAFSAMAAALLVRALRCPGDRDPKRLANITAALALVAIARVPYGALALMPLALTKPRLRWRLLAAATIAASVLAWSAIAAATALTNIGDYFGADPPAQLARLRADPLLLVRATWAALAQNGPEYLSEFVGRLSWFDLDLPPAYHTAACTILAVAALAAMLGLRGEPIPLRSRLILAAGVLLAAAGIFAVEFVAWTVPGHAAVEGVEGRYFLPLALAAAPLLPAFRHPRFTRLQTALELAVAVFPVVSLAVVMRAVVLRYYLG